jgi:hypothetical protein
MKKLGSFFNPEAQSLVNATERPNTQEQAFRPSGREDNASVEDDLDELGRILANWLNGFWVDGAPLVDEYDEPTKFKEAWK